MVAGVCGHLISSEFLEQQLRQASGPDLQSARQLAEWRVGTAALGPASSFRALIELGAEPLVRLLGFPGVDRIRQLDHVAIAHLQAPRPVALLVTAWAEPLDSYWRPAVVESRALGAEWCLLFNGQSVRLVDARRVYSKRYVEIDLDVAADDAMAARALWTMFELEAFGPRAGTCRVAGLIADSERHGVGVCRGLRNGVLQASGGILRALMAGRRRDPRDSFEQALTIVYRLLFLLFAEARSLVPMWHPIYRDSYSVESLRLSAERTDSVRGLWDALRALSRMAHSGCTAGDLRVTAFNGRLFAPGRTPLIERRNLDNQAIRSAVLSLSTRAAADGTGRERIVYRDLGVEQLGAVYETLLDYEPGIEPGAAASAAVTLQRSSGIRKATGTFYTPQPLAHYLVRRTLAPLVEQATPENILEIKVVDPAMGSGAFLVAACEYLAAAYGAALVRSGGCHPADLGPSEQAAIRRRIAERCLYGVDLNPMAVQLARLSLWLTTLAADRPLTFLDHHLQTGDSLIGAWLANLRFAPHPQRTPRVEGLTLFDTPALGEALRETLPGRFALASTAADTVEQVREKERLLTALTRRDAALMKWKRVADLWCASWFRKQDAPPPSAFGALSDAILTGTTALPGNLAEPFLKRGEALAVEHRFFHWELEFPEVFFDARGARRAAAGFDAVLGNPPWDMIRADFGSSEARAELRTDAAALVRFTRDSGVYAAQSDGHANRYQLFLERAIHLTRRGGRIGLVLPSGIMADQGSAKLRRLLFDQCGVDAIVGFDNRSGVFPIHRSVRFVLLTATGGTRTGEIACRLGERSPAALESGEADTDDRWFTVRVTPAVLERITGPDVSLPALVSPLDLTIAERAASLFPPLSDAAGWGASFGRELNATDDRACFAPPGNGLPVIEGKLINPFSAHIATARWSIPTRHADRLLGARYRRWRLGYRDVASATNRVTLIAALIPPHAVTTHTIFCLRTALSRADQHLLCGLFNSLVVNYLARLRVTTHVTTAIVERLPVPTRTVAPDITREIAALAVLLARRAGPDRPGPAFAKLNALVAELYQLTEAEFSYVLSTFPLVPVEQRNEALQAFQSRCV